MRGGGGHRQQRVERGAPAAPSAVRGDRGTAVLPAADADDLPHRHRAPRAAGGRGGAAQRERGASFSSSSSSSSSSSISSSSSCLNFQRLKRPSVGVTLSTLRDTNIIHDRWNGTECQALVRGADLSIRDSERRGGAAHVRVPRGAAHAPHVRRRVPGRGLHSPTFQLNLTRFGNTSPCPPV